VKKIVVGDDINTHQRRKGFDSAPTQKQILHHSHTVVLCQTRFPFSIFGDRLHSYICFLLHPTQPK